MKYQKHICIHTDMNHLCTCMRQKDHAQNHDLPEHVEIPLFHLIGDRMVTSA